MREAFEKRFGQIIDEAKVQVLAAQATTTRIRAVYPSAKTDLYFRWVGKGKVVAGGELRWTSLDGSEGEAFDLRALTTPESGSYRADYVLDGELRWFDDHPDSGDGAGLAVTDSQCLAYDNGDLFPSGLDLPGYLALQLAAPGLLRPVLYASPTLCSFQDAAAAKRFLAQRKDLAKKSSALAEKLFSGVDLRPLQTFLAAIGGEKLRAADVDGRVELRPR